VLEADGSCFGAVGQDVKPAAVDFKVCVLPLEGDAACEFSMHKGPRAKKMNPLKGAFVLAIPSGFDGKKNVTSVFSRPVLESFMFLHMPRDSEDFKLLLQIKLEPRVWKFLFVHFPGPGVFAPSDEVIGQSLSPRSQDALDMSKAPPPYCLMDDKDNVGATKDPPSDLLVDKKLNFFLKTEDLEEVTDLPIFSPTGAGTVAGSGFQSFQTTQGGMKGGASADGWSNASISL
jgi:hypothetical protein